MLVSKRKYEDALDTIKALRKELLNPNVIHDLAKCRSANNYLTKHVDHLYGMIETGHFREGDFFNSEERQLRGQLDRLKKKLRNMEGRLRELSDIVRGYEENEGVYWRSRYTNQIMVVADRDAQIEGLNKKIERLEHENGGLQDEIYKIGKGE